MNTFPIRAALLLAASAVALANPSLALANPAATDADEVVVTATRTARTVDETLAPVTVITRDDIERRQASSVEDLLRGVPGLSIANNGGPGKSTALFLRGTESDHVLVLIDGVKVGSATSGGASLQDIPVELVERIEVVRGPRSSLYGSEAIGGVIQIFTRKGGGALRPSLALGAGRHGTTRASAGVSGGNERSWFSAQLGSFATDGFNACSGKPSPGGAGCFVSAPDRDGYRSLSGSARAGLRFDNGARADVHWLRVLADNEFDNSTLDEAESVQHVVGGSVELPAAASWRMRLAAGQSRDESDNFTRGVFKSRFATRRDTASWQNDLDLGAERTLTLGLDWQDDRIDSTTAYALSSRDNRGAFAQYQAGYGHHDLQAALRRDDNEQFGGRTTGGLAWGWAFAPDLRLTASYGTAFKTPTFNELYFPNFGNPDLRPEKSRSVEVGLGGLAGRAGLAGAMRWSVNAFETRIDDMIAYDAARRAADNVDEARIRGVELVSAARAGAWDLAASLTLLDPRNRSAGANDDNVLPRRARRALRLDADRELGRWRLGATLHTEGRRYDDLGNRRGMGGYATIDVRADYAIAKDWRAQARLANLFDHDYETAAFFNQPGRSLFVTLRYEP